MLRRNFSGQKSRETDGRPVHNQENKSSAILQSRTIIFNMDNYFFAINNYLLQLSLGDETVQKFTEVIK